MNMKVRLFGREFSNPVWTASGTFGSGKEFEGLVDLRRVGAVTAKTVTLERREGNPPPRLVETASGLLNSIGLENGGVDHFLGEKYPFLMKCGAPVIVSIAGATPEEFSLCVGKFSGEAAPAAFEINLSCPNVVHEGGARALFSQNAEMTSHIIKAVKAATDVPVIAKLTPNVTDITEIAHSAEKAGADAVAVVNTYFGMAVDAYSMRPVLGNMVGGLSGPAIKPLALKAVWDVHGKVGIPVIGVGGVMTGIDVAEFMIAGASAVQTGTSNLADPASYERILGEFEEYLRSQKISDAAGLTGRIRR